MPSPTPNPNPYSTLGRARLHSDALTRAYPERERPRPVSWTPADPARLISNNNRSLHIYATVASIASIDSNIPGTSSTSSSVWLRALSLGKQWQSSTINATHRLPEAAIHSQRDSNEDILANAPLATRSQQNSRHSTMYGYFFTSPTSNTDMPIQPTPASRHTSTAMSRSDSRDSAISTTSSYSAAWDITSRPGSSAMTIPFPTQRRTSSSSSSSLQCGWFPSPYRSCLSHAALEDTTSSYLSDDDLLYLPPPIQELPTHAEANRELTTEEQIALLREQAEKEDAAPAPNAYRAEAWWTKQQRPQLYHQAAYADVKKAKAVRFAPGQAQIVTSGRRRSSTTAPPPKKRSPTVRRNLVELGQQ